MPGPNPRHPQYGGKRCWHYGDDPINYEDSAWVAKALRLSPTAIRIRNAGAADPLGARAAHVHENLVETNGRELASEMWVQALDELDDADGVERTEDR